MKIAVCIKQVVSREWQVRINDQKSWVRDQDAAWELNEPDAYALEEALRLKERHGGEVVVISAGGGDVIIECSGVPKGEWLKTPKGEEMDTIPRIGLRMRQGAHHSAPMSSRMGVAERG